MTLVCVYSIINVQVILSVLDGFAAAMPNSAEVKLRQHLFTGYDKSVRPVDRPEKFVNVSFSFQLSKIVELVSACKPFSPKIKKYTLPMLYRQMCT